MFVIVNSGKTTFLKRITSQNNFNIFKELIIDYLPSICATFKDVIIKFTNKVFKLIICDMTGKLKYFSLLNIFNQKANIILNFYDPFNKESFEYIKKSYQNVKELDNPYLCNCIIIKNKCDLNETKDKNIMISDEEVLEYSDKNNLLFRNLSNLEKYGSGIEEIIEDI